MVALIILLAERDRLAFKSKSRLHPSTEKRWSGLVCENTSAAKANFFALCSYVSVVVSVLTNFNDKRIRRKIRDGRHLPKSLFSRERSSNGRI